MKMNHFLISLLAIFTPVLILAAPPKRVIRPVYEEYYDKGEKAFYEGNVHKALEYYKKSLKDNPNFAESWKGLGETLKIISTAYSNDANKAFDRALNLDPNHEKTLEKQGEYYLTEGKLQDAKQNLEKLQELNSQEAATLKDKLEALLTEAAILLQG